LTYVFAVLVTTPHLPAVERLAIDTGRIHQVVVTAAMDMSPAAAS
jgi:hypothetical protein